MKQDLKYKTLRSKNTKELIKLVRFEFNLQSVKRKKLNYLGIVSWIIKVILIKL